MLSTELMGSADILGEVGLERAKAMGAPEAAPEPEPPKHVITEWEYNQFGRIGERLCAIRHLDLDLAWHYGLRWHQHKRCWIIPLRLPDGRLIGWQEKAKGYFMNVPDGVNKSECLFGYQQLTGDRVILVESPIDVVRLASAGYEGGLASFGVFVSDAQWRLIVARASVIVLALDNDRAGSRGHQVMRSWSPGSAKLLFANYAGFGGKDVGEATDDELERILGAPVMVPA